MNKRELIARIADATGLPKARVAEILDDTLDEITHRVKTGEKVTLPGFGTFERRARGARVARNPRTGEEIKIRATKVPAFSPGSVFKETVRANSRPKMTRLRAGRRAIKRVTPRQILCFRMSHTYRGTDGHCSAVD